LRVIRKQGPGAQQLKKLLSNIDAHTSKVGWFDSAKYPDGTQVAYVAAIQEFGAPSQGIPPRLGMRATITAQEQAWANLAGRIAKRLVKGEASVKDVMEAIGLKAAADFQKTITKVKEPPLSYVTLLLRKERRLGKTITGKTVGKKHAIANFVGPRRKSDKSASVSGVSTKPLIDTGYLLSTLTSVTERKT
jgi:hypothetical protein